MGESTRHVFTKSDMICSLTLRQTIGAKELSGSSRPVGCHNIILSMKNLTDVISSTYTDRWTAKKMGLKKTSMLPKFLLIELGSL